MDGRVDLRVGLDRDPATVDQQSRIPGRVFENLLILGSATNQEYASAPGDIRAFDVRTGALVWTFHTVPRPGEFGYDTWPEGAWKTVGGANNWGEQSIDEARGIVYVPTASPKFNFYGGNRKGANLFGDCLLALDVRTGKRLWHFQTVHHDIWDLDNNSAPQLTTIRRDGRTIDVVAMASKTGYLYVFDRVTGEPIWPIEERPVPQHTDVPGEALWPTQPIPTSPPPFSRQKFTVDDLNPYILTPTERDEFRQRILKAQERRALHADRLRRSAAHARQSGRIELGQHRGEPDRRQRVRHRLQRAGADSPVEAWRGASRAKRAPAGGGEGRAVPDRWVRALSDDCQSAVHDADRVRSEPGHDQDGRSASATIDASSVRASPGRARPRRSRAG